MEKGLITIDPPPTQTEQGNDNFDKILYSLNALSQHLGALTKVVEANTHSVHSSIKGMTEVIEKLCDKNTAVEKKIDNLLGNPNQNTSAGKTGTKSSTQH